MAGILVLGAGCVSGMGGLGTGIEFECGLQMLKFLGCPGGLVWGLRLGVPTLMFIGVKSYVKDGKRKGELYLEKATGSAMVIAGFIGFGVSMVCTYSMSKLFE